MPEQESPAPRARGLCPAHRSARPGERRLPPRDGCRLNLFGGIEAVEESTTKWQRRSRGPRSVRSTRLRVGPSAVLRPGAPVAGWLYLCYGLMDV